MVDLNKKTFTVRNNSKLPFVQTTVLLLPIQLHCIKKIECFSAYKIYINGTKRWDLIGYVPSWSGLYVTYCLEDDSHIQTQLLFIGAKIPESMYAFFAGVLKINISDVKNFSRFDK